MRMLRIMIFILGLLISVFVSNLEAFEMDPTKDSGVNVLSVIEDPQRIALS